MPPGEELVGVGADLEPGTLLAAYRGGVFPMPVARQVGRRGKTGPIGWWSPDPRGVLPLEQLRVTRSLRASCRRFEIRVDTAYDEVVSACADPHRPGGWIRRDIKAAYRRLHELGWVHSVEAWTVDARGRARLAGGLYGVAIGGLFAGESMFHRERDASKVALVGLVSLLRAAALLDRESGAGATPRLLDVQWATSHLTSLGVREMPRSDYLAGLPAALALPPPRFGPVD
jgi:leucyl/phenylalanyl-tRNA---protein transferase